MRFFASAVLLFGLTIATVAESVPAASTSPAPAVSAQEAQLLPCLIVKRRSLSDRVVGFGILPGNRYDLVDAQSVAGAKMVYKAKELEFLQSANVKVVVLQKTYSVEELKGARSSCGQN
jgi:hypothetical protein